MLFFLALFATIILIGQHNYVVNSFAQTVISTNGTSSLLNNNEIAYTPPKLRILIFTTRIPITETHYVLHRKMAELLADDAENVEKVLLLAARLDCAETSEMPLKFDGRFLVWNRMTFGTNVTQNLDECQQIVNKAMQELQTQPKLLWEHNDTRFLPKADQPVMGNLEFLKNHQKLIQQLQQHNFNVGIMETNPGEFALSLLAIFPTIKKFVGSQSTAPTIAHWKYFGYEKIVGAMPGGWVCVCQIQICIQRDPLTKCQELTGQNVDTTKGRDLAQIGDHQFATENAIKINPNYFRERNENLYIKPIENAGKILQNFYLDAIEEVALPRQFPDEFVLHENFTAWEMGHRMDLYFTNVQPFLDFPIVEQEIERERLVKNENRVNFIGGITMPRSKAPNLNGDTKQIFESAKNGGVVLLSFGSVVEMDEDDAHAVAVKNHVVDVFKQYTEMNMIIKWGKRRPTNGTTAGEEFEQLSDNVYAKSWLEQSAILGADGLKLFITHGGQNSINEAVKFGVPLILFPFFGDQFNNAEALAARGVAKVIDIRSKTLQNEFSNALNELLSNYSTYKQKMDELSKKMNSVEPEKEFIEKFRQLRKSL